MPFIDQGIDGGESVLVAVPSDRLRLLTGRYGDGNPQLRFADMEVLGRNPAWIIPAWAAFVAGQETGRPARGIGQPIWASRSHDELVECSRHESLINVAFAGADGFRLLCPYDTASLEHAVIEESLHNHPNVATADAVTSSGAYTGVIPSWLESPLSPVPPRAEVLTFHTGDLARVRHRAAALAASAGLRSTRVDDLVVAVSEAITNSALHAGGTGEIALWRDGGRFLCEIRDGERCPIPSLAGCGRRPTRSAVAGSGRSISCATSSRCVAYPRGRRSACTCKEDDPPMTSTSMSSAEGWTVPQPEEPHVVVLEGEIDLLTATTISDPIKRLATSGPSTIVLDFERVTFIDSTGLGALLAADRSLRASGRCLVLRAVAPRVLRLLQVTQLDRALTIEEP